MKILERSDFLWEELIRHNLNKKFLDCASSDGAITSQRWFKRGLSPFNYTAVDVDRQKLDKLKDMGVTTICFDLETDRITKYLNKSFDIIICTETLEHLTLKTSINLLADFLFVLNKGGEISISFPIKCVINEDSYGHIRQPTINEIKNVLELSFEKCIIEQYIGGKKYNRPTTQSMLFKYRK